jgi:uroporphyrinogen-III synthase
MSYTIDFTAKLVAKKDLPLLGKRIFFPTPRNYAGLLTRLLVERGARPIWAPTIEIYPVDDYSELDAILKDLKGWQWIAFTSTNGVEAVAQRLKALGKPVDEMKKCKLAAFAADAKALEALGIKADLMPRQGDPQGMIDDLKAMGVKGHKVLVPVPRVVGVEEPYVVPEFIKDLQKIGMVTKRLEVYQTNAVTGGLDFELDALLERRVDVTALTSSAETFALLKLRPGLREAINKTTVAYMGPYTAKTGVKEGLRSDIMPKKMDMPGLVEAIEEYFLKKL